MTRYLCLFALLVLTPLFSFAIAIENFLTHYHPG